MGKFSFSASFYRLKCWQSHRRGRWSLHEAPFNIFWQGKRQTFIRLEKISGDLQSNALLEAGPVREGCSCPVKIWLTSGIESTVSLDLCSSACSPSWYKKQTNKKKTHNILYTYLKFPQFTSSHKHPLSEVRHWEGRWKKLILSSFRSDICLNFLFNMNSVFDENFPAVILRFSFYWLIKFAFPLLRARLNSKSCPTREVVQWENRGFKTLLVSHTHYTAAHHLHQWESPSKQISL